VGVPHRRDMDATDELPCHWHVRSRATPATETVLQSPPETKSDIRVVTRPNRANELHVHRRQLRAKAVYIPDCIILPNNSHKAHN